MFVLRHENGDLKGGWCDISTLISIDSFNQLEKSANLSDIACKNMKGLFKMHNDCDGYPLIRGTIMPEKYLKYEDLDDQKLSELPFHSAPHDVEFDINDFYADEDEADEHDSTIKRNTVEEDMNFFQYMQSITKEICKNCENNKNLTAYAKKKQTELLEDIVQKRHDTFPQSQDASMISSNAMSEMSPNRKRYKRYYERNK